MKLKKLLALLLAMVMALSVLSGCGPTEPSGDGTPAPASQPGGDEADDPDDERDDDPEEVKEIIVELFTTTATSTEVAEEISAAINEISEKLINVRVNLHYNAPADIGTRVSVGIPAGDQMDLLCFNPAGGSTFGTLVAQKQVMDMTPYLQEHAPKALELTADYLAATTVDGKIMGIPNLRELNESFWLTMNKDILEELDLVEQAEACDNWTAYAEIMRQVVDNSTLAGIGPNDANGSIVENYAFYVGEEKWSDTFAFDNLGDQYSLIYVDAETDTVMNYYSTQEYKNAVTMAHQWYVDGLVYKDSAITEQTRDAQLSGNLSFSISGQGGPSTPVNKASSTGHSVICKELGTPATPRRTWLKFGPGRPVTCKEPEAAAKFLELMYTNADVMNILLWGIEGKDWVLNENGEACYPEGVDGGSARYHKNEDFFPNCYIAYPWEGMGGDYRDVSFEKLQNTPVSKYVGLSVDTSSIADQITACFNVSKQYRAVLNCGQADPATELPKFLAALEEAGVQDIIDCYQTQLNDWLAANG